MVVWTAAEEDHASVLWLLFPVAALAGCLVSCSLGRLVRGVHKYLVFERHNIMGEVLSQEGTAGAVVVRERKDRMTGLYLFVLGLVIVFRE